jgi:hypothetical protein
MPTGRSTAPSVVEHGCGFSTSLAQGYADDAKRQDRMQSALNCVENWCRKVALSVNAHKTKMLMFTNNRKIMGVFIILDFLVLDDGSGEISGSDLE